jgi:hypothetical protein
MWVGAAFGLLGAGANLVNRALRPAHTNAYVALLHASAAPLLVGGVVAVGGMVTAVTVRTVVAPRVGVASGIGAVVATLGVAVTYGLTASEVVFVLSQIAPISVLGALVGTGL